MQSWADDARLGVSGQWVSGAASSPVLCHVLKQISNIYRRVQAFFFGGWSSKLGLHYLSGSAGIESGRKDAFSPRSPKGQRFSSRWPTPGVFSRTSDARPSQEELGRLVGCQKRRRFLLSRITCLLQFGVVTGVSRDIWVHAWIQTL